MSGADDRDVRAVLDLVPVLVGVALSAHDAADVPVTLPQYRALFVLERWGPSAAGALAARLNVHTSSVTRVCDRLVRSGYMTRVVNDDNRREVVLTITPEGSAVVDQVLAVRAAEVRRILDAMPDAARTALVGLVPSVLAAATTGGPVVEVWAG